MNLRSKYFIITLFFICFYTKHNELLAQNIRTQINKDTVLAKEYYKKGVASYKSSNYDSAIFYLSKAIDFDSTNYLYYSYRGLANKSIEKFDFALKDLNEAIQKNKMNARLYYYRGDVEQLTNNYDKAVKDFDTALSLKQDYKEALYKKAMCNRYLSKYQDALKDMNYLISELPDVKFQYAERGQDYFELKNYSLAILDFNEYLNSGQKEGVSGILYQRGVSYYFIEKIDSAILDLEKVIKVQPGAIAYHYLALAYMFKNDSLHSIQNFEKCIQMEPTCSNYFLYAQAEYYFGNCIKALSLMETSETLWKKENILNLKYNRVKAGIEACIKDTIEAIKYFNVSIQIDSNNYKTYLTRILCLHYNAKYSKIVLNDISKLIEIYPNKKDLTFLYTMKGLYTVYTGDTLKAEEFYKKAIEIAPEKSYTYYNLAAYNFYFRNRFINNVGNKKVVIESLKKSISLDKKNFDAYKLLAMYYAVIEQDSNKGCEVMKEAERNIKENIEIKAFKDILCKGEDVLHQTKVELIMIPPDETGLTRIFFCTPEQNSQIIKDLDLW